MSELEDTPKKLTILKPIDWNSSWHLSESIKGFQFPVSKDGDYIKALPVILVDPSLNISPMNPRGAVVIKGEQSDTIASLGSFGASLAGGAAGICASAEVFLWNPLSGNIESLRTPTKFVTLGLTIALGDTVIWPANATKKIRILGFDIQLASGTTSVAASTLTVKDNATAIFTYALAGAALAASPVGVTIARVRLPGNGYLCAAVNTPVNLNLSTALAIGGVTVNMWGTEE